MERLKIHFPLLGSEPPVDLPLALRVNGFQPWEITSVASAGAKYLNEQAADLFESVPLDEARLLFYPYRVDHASAAEAAEIARRRNLPIVFLDWGDQDIPRPMPYGVVFRHSLDAARKLPHEQAMAAFVPDPLEGDGGVVPLREKGQTPSIGFCGFVGTPWSRLAYRLLGRREKHQGLELRLRAIRAFRADRRIKTDFILRGSYWAGKAGQAKQAIAGQATAHQAFLANLRGCDYALTLRGAGNFSYRFYEVLAMGRIPVFINTRCVLPFEDEIDYRKHCVWIEESDLARAGQRLLDFHQSLTPAAFRDMQIANRQLWLDRLTGPAFYNHALRRLAATTP